MSYAIRGKTDGKFRRYDEDSYKGREESVELEERFVFPSMEVVLREVAKITEAGGIITSDDYPQYEVVRVEYGGYDVVEVLE